MHTLAVALAPVLAAEKSKVPFYIAGGLLVVWAITLSMVLGMRKADFPHDLRGQRTISAITLVLVLGAMSTAVLTAGSPAKSEAAAATQPAATSEAPAPSAPATTATTPSAPAATAPAGGAHTSLKLAASSGALAYDTKTLSAKAGTVTIDFTNQSPLEHNVTIAQGSTVLGATPTFTGGSRTLTLNLKPGKYTFYCTVPGHRQAGMEGTLNIS
jgi:plastocyanin